jgi:hypothetical protein
MSTAAGFARPIDGVGNSIGHRGTTILLSLPLDKFGQNLKENGQER